MKVAGKFEGDREEFWKLQIGDLRSLFVNIDRRCWRTKVKNSRILIVDDDPNSCFLVERVLHSEGYENTLVANSGAEALEIANREHLDLILLDIMMPQMDGYEVCRRLKQNEHLWDIPVIVVTARKSSQALKQSFDVGAIDYIAKPVDLIELIARTESALRTKKAYDELLSQNQNLERLNRDLERVNTTDELTGLKNVRYFWGYIETEVKKFRRFKYPLSLIMGDIDDFKQINDTYGHLVGDAVLKQSGEIFLKNLRDYDLVARYGGEEFAFVLVNTDINEGAVVAEKVREAVGRQEIRIGDAVIQYTISLGVATLEPKAPEEHISSYFLVDRADKALYAAKRGGKNRIALAD